MSKNYLKPPPEQLFWKVLSYSMDMISLMDRRWWGYHAHRLLVVTKATMDYCTPIAVVSQLIYLYLNFNNVSAHQLHAILIMGSITIVINVKLLASKTVDYAKIMKKFWYDIHLYHHQTDNFSKKQLINCELYTRIMTVGLATIIGLDCVMLNAVPLYFNIKNKVLIDEKKEKLMSALYLVLPFDYEYNYNNWLIVLSVYTYMVGLAGFFLTVSDIVCFAIVFHLIGHIQIFKFKIRELTETFDDLDERSVRARIIELVEYHTFLKRSFEEMKNGFGVSVTTNYLFNLVIDSVILYQIMTRDKTYAFVYSVMFLVFMGNLVMMSFILEEIRRQSKGLAETIYFLPWEKMSVSNQKMILLILRRIQPELSFIGAGGLKTGVELMFNIIKSTFSYYVMLKQKV